MLDNLQSETTRSISIQAEGATLRGRLFAPFGQPTAALVLNGATGVPHEFYAHFARWLATERGIACLTFDYRDFGASRVGSLASSRTQMSDWALRDMPAARATMRRLYPDVPLWVLGHSLGGMLTPSQSGIEEIDRMICVCSGMVHHKDHPWPYQGLARLFWFVLGPLITRTTGYLAGRRAGFGADLPPEVFWQWRRWCTSPDFYLPDCGWDIPQPNWRRCGAPVQMFALSDDDLCPPICTEKLSTVYDGQAVCTVLDPAKFGLGKVGHTGLFRRRNAMLWPAVIDDCVNPS